jgi:hypothetical protein
MCVVCRRAPLSPQRTPPHLSHRARYIDPRLTSPAFIRWPSPCDSCRCRSRVLLTTRASGGLDAQTVQYVVLRRDLGEELGWPLGSIVAQVPPSPRRIPGRGTEVRHVRTSEDRRTAAYRAVRRHSARATTRSLNYTRAGGDLRRFERRPGTSRQTNFGFPTRSILSQSPPKSVCPATRRTPLYVLYATLFSPSPSLTARDARRGATRRRRRCGCPGTTR